MRDKSHIIIGSKMDIGGAMKAMRSGLCVREAVIHKETEWYRIYDDDGVERLLFSYLGRHKERREVEITMSSLEILGRQWEIVREEKESDE